MRRTTRIVTILFALVTTALAASIATANDGAVGTQGGTVRPIGDADIRMDSEAVQIVALRDYALYRIDFKFVNVSGQAKTVKLGFPFPDFENEEEDNSGEPPGAFRAWLNGTELAVAQEDGVDSDGESEWKVVWFTHVATFPPGESMVTVHYLGVPDSSVQTPDLLDGVSFSAGVDPERVLMGYYPYILHTGAGWKDTIAKSVVRYTLSDEFDGFGVDQVMRNYAEQSWIDPGRAANLRAFTKPAEGEYEWVFTDYEPTSDHDVVLAFAEESEYSEDFDPWEDTKASSELDLGEYAYPAWNAANGYPGDAWAEAADGPGIGEWIDIPFGETRTVRQIRVLPGYQKRLDLYQKYNRPKRLRIDLSDGTSQEIELADEIGMQVFSTNAEADSAKVTILEVYQGTNERDETYLSEIDFAEGPAPRFATFEAVTGIAPPAGYTEPAALAALTDPGLPPDDPLGGPNGEMTLGEDDIRPPLGGLLDGDLLVIAGAGACCCGLVLVGAIVLVVVLVRRKKAPTVAPTAPPPPAAPPVTPPMAPPSEPPA